jgi:hypothetical protein
MPPAPAGIAGFFSGFTATLASVVASATEAASCRAPYSITNAE